MNFKICEDVSALGIKVAFLVIYGIDNNQHNNAIKKKIEKFYSDFLEEYSSEKLGNDASILGYRKLHKNIGINDKSLVASPESLINLLFKYKALRPINFIVDTYNYVAIKNKVSIGAHDLKHIQGNVRLCFTDGNEHFIPLGKDKPKNINCGEYCYIDDNNEILCRLDCRQCNKTKTTIDTKDCLFIIQGHKDIPIELITSTATELQNIFIPYSTNDKRHTLTVM